MELHWEKLSEEKSLAIVAPGIWFEINKTDYGAGEFNYVRLKMYSCYCGEIQFDSFGGSKEEKIIQQHIVDMKNTQT